MAAWSWTATSSLRTASRVMRRPIHRCALWRTYIICHLLASASGARPELGSTPEDSLGDATHTQGGSWTLGSEFYPAALPWKESALQQCDCREATCPDLLHSDQYVQFSNGFDLEGGLNVPVPFPLKFSGKLSASMKHAGLVAGDAGLKQMRISLGGTLTFKAVFEVSVTVKGAMDIASIDDITPFSLLGYGYSALLHHWYKDQGGEKFMKRSSGEQSYVELVEDHVSSLDPSFNKSSLEARMRWNVAMADRLSLLYTSLSIKMSRSTIRYYDNFFAGLLELLPGVDAAADLDVETITRALETIHRRLQREFRKCDYVTGLCMPWSQVDKEKALAKLVYLLRECQQLGITGAAKNLAQDIVQSFMDPTWSFDESHEFQCSNLPPTVEIQLEKCPEGLYTCYPRLHDGDDVIAAAENPSEHEFLTKGTDGKYSYVEVSVPARLLCSLLDGTWGGDPEAAALSHFSWVRDQFDSQEANKKLVLPRPVMLLTTNLFTSLHKLQAPEAVQAPCGNNLMDVLKDQVRIAGQSVEEMRRVLGSDPASTQAIVAEGRAGLFGAKFQDESFRAACESMTTAEVVKTCNDAVSGSLLCFSTREQIMERVEKAMAVAEDAPGQQRAPAFWVSSSVAVSLSAKASIGGVGSAAPVGSTKAALEGKLSWMQKLEEVEVKSLHNVSDVFPFYSVKASAQLEVEGVSGKFSVGKGIFDSSSGRSAKVMKASMSPRMNRLFSVGTTSSALEIKVPLPLALDSSASWLLLNAEPMVTTLLPVLSNLKAELEQLASAETESADGSLEGSQSILAANFERTRAVAETVFRSVWASIRDKLDASKPAIMGASAVAASASQAHAATATLNFKIRKPDDKTKPLAISFWMTFGQTLKAVPQWLTETLKLAGYSAQFRTFATTSLDLTGFYLSKHCHRDLKVDASLPREHEELQSLICES
eukprot:TRINITY_DN22323_c0_g1_i1.p1 TRINITY_DN22323_c0_g1~~TRINITY_DN22323_c0_g1_i1.p1  ORF type:complete len:938 (-),score=123.40 TRINITY_DN22323_c0_g1_i1:161-2974(-)